MASPRIAGVRLEALFQQAREPVFALSAELRLVYVNRAWEALTGYAAAAVAGLDCRSRPAPPGDGAAAADGRAALAGCLRPPAEVLAGQSAGGPTVLLRANGERLWRRVEFWPYHDAEGRLLAVLGLVRDLDASPHAPDAQATRLRGQLLALRARLLGRYGFESLVGAGPSHRRLLDQVRAAAATTVPVLLVGEPGTGKRTVARTIHQQGARAQEPVIALDCAALPPEVLESALFGAPGAAAELPRAQPPGLALPIGSSLLIGDILDLPRDLQSRLAAALDDRVRLLATTVGDPDQARASDRLRPDLYYALTTLIIRLRPLRERLDELPMLAQAFLERANDRGGRQRVDFSTAALDALAKYDWPGNLRELARVVEAAHARGDDEQVQAADLPAAIRGHLGAAYLPPPLPATVTPLDELLTRLERRLIERALHQAGHNKSRAAELLAISRPRLYRRIKELHIPEEPEPPAGDHPAPRSAAPRHPPDPDQPAPASPLAQPAAVEPFQG